MRRHRRQPAGEPPPAPSPPANRLHDLRPVHLDYDEARTAEERETYHQPRLLPAPGEFLLDVHPLARAKALAKRRRPAP